jgi:hypothetical protein
MPDSAIYVSGVVPRSSHPPQIDLASIVGPTAFLNFGPAEPERFGIDGHVEIKLPSAMRITTIEVSLGGDDYYEVGVALGREYRYVGRVFPETSGGVLVRRILDVDPRISIADRVWFMALAGDGLYTVENLSLHGFSWLESPEVLPPP